MEGFLTFLSHNHIYFLIAAGVFFVALIGFVLALNKEKKKANTGDISNLNPTPGVEGMPAGFQVPNSQIPNEQIPDLSVGVNNQMDPGFGPTPMSQNPNPNYYGNEVNPGMEMNNQVGEVLNPMQMPQQNVAAPTMGAETLYAQPQQPVQPQPPYPSQPYGYGQQPYGTQGVPQQQNVFNNQNISQQ